MDVFPSVIVHGNCYSILGSLLLTTPATESTFRPCTLMRPFKGGASSESNPAKLRLSRTWFFKCRTNLVPAEFPYKNVTLARTHSRRKIELSHRGRKRCSHGEDLRGLPLPCSRFRLCSCWLFRRRLHRLTPAQSSEQSRTRPARSCPAPKSL